MRLKQTRVRTFYATSRILTADNEGVNSVSWGEPFEVRGEIWKANSTRQIAEYGDRIENVANMYVEGKYTITLENKAPKVTFSNGNVLRPNDGVYVYADTDGDPDYVIRTIEPCPVLMLEVERIG